MLLVIAHLLGRTRLFFSSADIILNMYADCFVVFLNLFILTMATEKTSNVFQARLLFLISVWSYTVNTFKIRILYCKAISVVLNVK